MQSGPRTAPALSYGASAASVAPGAEGGTPQLLRGEKLRLQVLRVQLALKRLGLYEGAINGEFTAETQEALKHFQIVKGLPPTGLMLTDSLNALGVPAVN